MKKLHRGRILVVGAGCAGAAYARQLADAGYMVEVIDQRPHIAGNAFDYVDENGNRVHRYGPHVFHTNQSAVFRWLKRFAEFVPYYHKVKADIGNNLFATLPVNLDTINTIFGMRLTDSEAARAFLKKVSMPCANPCNAAEYLNSIIGTKMTDLLFRPYTRKMWALDLEDMDVSVVKRIPIRLDLEDRYFADDVYQFLPSRGYTDLFERLLDHSLIHVRTNAAFEPGAERQYMHCFNSMSIDEFFGFAFGELPYRSVRFLANTHVDKPFRNWAVTNFTDDGVYTRETWWHCFPNHAVRETGRQSITSEMPCDYRENGLERYYPIKTADFRNQHLYKKYEDLARSVSKVNFIGRCGSYQYLNMDQVINQSLAGVRRWLSRPGG